MGVTRAAVALALVVVAVAAAVALLPPVESVASSPPEAQGPWSRAEGTQVVALRGSRVLSPENSVAAHHLAANLGADLLHADVTTLGGGRARVISSAALSKLGPKGRAVSSLVEAELDSIDSGENFEVEGRGKILAGKGLRPPTLLEWMTRFRAVPVLLELQGRDVGAADDLVRALNQFMTATQLEGHGGFAERLEDRIIVSAQSLAVTERVRAAFQERLATVCAPEESLLILWATQWPQLWPIVEWAAPNWRQCAVVQAPAVVGRHRFASRDFVVAAHRLGKRVVLGVANEAATMRQLVDLGVDGILTDRPDVAHALLSKEQPEREEKRLANFDTLGSYDVPLHNTGTASDELDFCPLVWAPLLRVEPPILVAIALFLATLAIYVLLAIPAALLRLALPSSKAEATQQKSGSGDGKDKTQAADVEQLHTPASADQQGVRKRKPAHS